MSRVASGHLTNTCTSRAANRLTAVSGQPSAVSLVYNGVGDRVAQTVDGNTINFALDVVGLPEVIYTSEGNAYLHLPGVIVAESASGEVRYLLSDGLGSIRQAVDESGAVVGYNEFDPYGNPTQNSTLKTQNYGFTGEWWQSEVGLLHLRARWYMPEDGVFLSRDSVESEPAYQYVRGNPVNRTDPRGLCAEIGDETCWGVYEKIILLCPECAEMERYLTDGRKIKLHENNIRYLQIVLENVQNGWYPSEPDYGFVGTVINSHLQKNDGIVFGVTGSATSLFLAGSPWYIPLENIKVNECQLPASGVTGGYEIVFDFKHLERGIFSYDGTALNIGTFYGTLGGATYVGKTRGFARQKYKVGVESYGGYFASAALNIGTKSLPAGLTVIEAAPLNDERQFNPKGIFATYYGLGVSVPIPLSSPVNVDLTVTNYTLLPGRREHYVPETELTKKQQDIATRQAIAAKMTGEIIGLGALWPGGLPFAGSAIGELWGFTNDTSN